MENLEPPVMSAGPVSEPEPEMGHSGLGIASLVMGILAAVSFVAVIFYAGYKETTTRGGMSEGETILVGLLAILCCAILLVGLVLGIVGLFQTQKRRVFAGIGVGVNVVIAAIIGGLFWLGLTQA